MANLIGRFETQNKRLSISATSPSRSSSVVSHITGDSVREETREKREWPPKSVASTEKPPLVIPTSFRHIPPSPSSQPILDPSPSTSLNSQVTKGDPASPLQAELEVPLTAKALQTQIAEAPSSFLENWRKDIPLVPAEMAPETDPTSTELTIEDLVPSLPTPTAASIQKFGNPIAPRTPTTGTIRPPGKSSLANSKASKGLVKGIIKSPTPKQSLSSSTTQLLRPQHTGQSVASTTSTRKPTSKQAPMTPKTVTRSDVSRAKTPTSARPKTPSTGLFAPTAASLARSRNAPPQLPTPTKKPTLSSSSMDRLSKPTAASLSKARTPVVAASTSTSRPTVAKTKTTPTTTKSKEPIAQKPAAQTVVAAPDQNGSSTIPAATEDNAIEAEAPPVSDTVGEVVLVDEEALSEDADPTPISPLLAAPEESVVEDEYPTSAPEPVANNLDEHKPTDELEAIVNLLESVPVVKSEPAIIPDIPDDILEIPDEDKRQCEEEK